MPRVPWPRIWSGRHDDAEVAEDRRTWTSPPLTAQGTGRTAHQGATLPRTPWGWLARPVGTQSMAFFRTAGEELLFSGEAISRPSWSIKSCLGSFPFPASLCSASRSWSNSGSGKSFRSMSVTSAPALRARLGSNCNQLLVEGFPARAAGEGQNYVASFFSLLRDGASS